VTEPVQKPGRSKQNYETPWPFVEIVKRRLGIDEFDIDLAADETNTKAPVWLTAQEDALSLDVPWRAEGWCWLNPPFANIGAWARKCAEAAADLDTRIAFLVPASVGSNWYRDYVHKAHARALFLNGRITFVGEQDPFPKDLMLVLYQYGNQGNDVWSWKAEE